VKIHSRFGYLFTLVFFGFLKIGWGRAIISTVSAPARNPGITGFHQEISFTIFSNK
jgi:hypothetical protein